MTGGFVTGDEVEVTSEEEGFAGAYFAASVVRCLPIVKRYTVSHHSLLSDRGGPLRETVDARLVRPRPRPRPPSSSSPPPNYRLHDCVDAFQRDAWWSGVVVSPPQSASSKASVVVCFPLYREVLSFDPSQIRPHLEWLSDRWVPPSLLVPFSSPLSLIFISLSHLGHDKQKCFLCLPRKCRHLFTRKARE